MKRLGSSDSLGALMSICPTTSEEHSPGNNHVYSREFQSMLEGLDEEGCIEEYSQTPEKKRRLSIHQVKALEKNFEVENKLEPERKVKLAQELGLQPRQVAVWFQNRRARWKTKQLERDYGLLKANHDSLKHSFDALQLDNQSLLKEIRELKSKLNEDNTEHDGSVKEELIVSEHDDDDKIIKQNTEPPVATTDMNCESFNNSNGVKDGSSDSDSSAILNEDNSPNAAISSSTGASLVHNQQFTVSPSPPSSSSVLKFGCSSTMNCYQFSDSKAILGETQKANYQAQLVKLEEHNFFNGDDEACNFFSDDQAPTLQWYCSDQWN